MTCAIVASILPASFAELANAAAAALADADLLEVRCDHAGAEFDHWLERLSDLPLPTIVTIRRREEGGKFCGSETERISRLRAAADRSPWIDVEARCDLALKRVGSARRIVSWHDLENCPNDPERLARELAARHPDALIKVATQARHLADVARLARAQRAIAPLGRVALFALGELGQATRLLAGKLGARLVYGSVAGHAATAPGQPTVHELAWLHRVRDQRPDTPAGAVLGDPIGHSLSPRFHSALCRGAGLVRAFVPIRCVELAPALDACDALGIAACSITLPHKQAAAGLAIGPIDGEPWPPFAGVANTLLRDRVGWRAANTDVTGFLAALDAGWPSDRAAPRRALLLGAGGVARTALAALRGRAISVIVAGRTDARAAALAAEFGATAVRWSDRAGVERDLIVQATPLGMQPEVSATPLPAAALRASDVVFELIYRPAQTQLLRDARECGAATIGGSEMFVAQALAQHRLWTGSASTPEAIAAARAALAEALAQPA